MDETQKKALEKFLEPEMVEEIIKAESGEKQSTSPRRELNFENLDEFYKARKLDKKDDN